MLIEIRCGPITYLKSHPANVAVVLRRQRTQGEKGSDDRCQRSTVNDERASVLAELRRIYVQIHPCRPRLTSLLLSAMIIETPD